MADNDFNTVKPIESLQTIQGLKPVERRQERQRRRDGQTDRHEEPQETPDQTEDRPKLDDGQSHEIDYCA